MACDLLVDLKATATKLAFRAPISDTTTPRDTVLFTGRDIKSYNGTTGEVIFTDSLAMKHTLSYHKISCYLNSDSLFTATLTSDIMSSVVNDLVLNHNLSDGKYYFEDGYPASIDNLGTHSIRIQNKEKRAVAWARFIAQLKTEKRFVEN